MVRAFPPTAALALEEALAGFSLGDDAGVEAIAGRWPTLRAALAPLIAAARGEPVGRAPAGAAPALGWLYAATRAVVTSDQALGKRVAKLGQHGTASQREALRAALRLAAGRGFLEEFDVIAALGEPRSRDAAAAPPPTRG